MWARASTNGARDCEDWQCKRCGMVLECVRGGLGGAAQAGVTAWYVRREVGCAALMLLWFLPGSAFHASGEWHTCTSPEPVLQRIQLQRHATSPPAELDCVRQRLEELIDAFLQVPSVICRLQGSKDASQ